MSAPNSFKECRTPDEVRAYFNAQAQAAREIYEDAIANLQRAAQMRVLDFEIERQRLMEDERKQQGGTK